MSKDKQVEEIHSICKSCIHCFVCSQCDDSTLVCTEYKNERAYCNASEVFEEVKRLLIQYRKGNISEYRLFIKIAELQQKYESEEENNDFVSESKD